MNMLSITLY